MDLISIVQTLWRYKKFVIPVLVLTAVAGLYIVKIKPPVYESTASVLLTNPQSTATPSQIKADPSLKTANPYNPFVSYGDLTVLGNAVMDLITSPAEAATLEQKGITKFTLSLSTDFGNPPIIEITGQGATRQAAIQSAQELVLLVKDDLVQVQKTEGVAPFYMISTYEVVKPVDAEASSSGKLRSLIAILAVGVLLVLVVVSAADALAKRRRSADPPPNGSRSSGSERDVRSDPGLVADESDFSNYRAPGPVPANGRPQPGPAEYRSDQGYPRR